jgi:hypothetical protein
MIAQQLCLGQAVRNGLADRAPPGQAKTALAAEIVGRETLRLQRTPVFRGRRGIEISDMLEPGRSREQMTS